MIMSGEISQFSAHLAGIKGKFTSCSNVPNDAKKKLLDLLKKFKTSKQEKESTKFV